MKKVFLLTFLLFAFLLNIIPYPRIITVCPKKSDIECQKYYTEKNNWSLNKNLSTGCICGVMPGIAIGFPNTFIEGDNITEKATIRVIANIFIAIFPAILITGLASLFKKFKQKKQQI